MENPKTTDGVSVVSAKLQHNDKHFNNRDLVTGATHEGSEYGIIISAGE